MSFFKRCLLPSLLFLILISCQKSENRFEGSWIGTAETKPFPELLFLYSDTSLMVKMFYSGIDLHKVTNFSTDANQIHFEVNQAEFRGQFDGILEDDTIKGILKSGINNYPCNFVKIQPEGPETVSEYAGFYQLDNQHIIQFTPYALDFSLTPLSVTDFNTGKKRIAFPIGNENYLAGSRMLSPYPTDFKIHFNKTEDIIRLELKTNEQSLTGEKLAELEEIIDISAENEGVELRASINLPASKGPFPLVVIVHGAGDQSRENYTLQDFAALLPYYGIATLIYDKRGCGESGGNLQSAGFETLSNDLQAIIQSATKLKEIEAENIGLMGIDQAGYIMPQLANKNPNIKFIVGISTPVLGMQTQELNACAMRMKSDGFSESDIEAALTYQKTMFAFLDGEIDSAQFQNASDQMETESWSNYVTSFNKKEWIQWWRKNYNYSPKDNLKDLSIPTFTIYGGKDLLTNPEENLAVLENLFQGENHKKKIYKDANHFMYIAGNRGDFQLSEIKGYPEGIFNEINEWIAERFGIIKNQ